jgi:uncharacterized repeat protein (TIGR01451 family)
MKKKTNRLVAAHSSVQLICCTLLAIALCAGEAFGQKANDVAVTLKAQKVLRTKEGKEVLQVADRAMPGEIIQYDAVYKNQSSSSVRQLEPTLPIPAGLEYVADSAKPAPARASLDGKSFAPIPLMRQVTLPTGETKQEQIPFSEYRALRWELGNLDAGKTALISARAKLVLK